MGCPAIRMKPDFQLRLIQLVETDDLALAETPEAGWYRILKSLKLADYLVIAALYYDALLRFNDRAAAQRQLREMNARLVNPESKKEAQQRLLFERVTMGSAEPLLHEPPAARDPLYTDPQSLATGKTPRRMAGKDPKDFFSLLQAYIGVTLMGRNPEPEEVHHALVNNPAFARACGFTIPDRRAGYRQSDVPSLRKLEQFDQIMTEEGLWGQLKLDELRRSVESGAIQPETTLIHDTTHYHAASGFEVVRYGEKEDQKKSASHVTKRCGCADKLTCAHEWEYSDAGAGTVVKSSGRIHWAHKASLLLLAEQGVILDAYAVSDAATHDGETVLASLDRLYATQPYLRTWFKTLLDDGAADSAELKAALQADPYHLRLVCSPNPRRRQAITKDLPRGVEKITPAGEPICLAGHPFSYRGVRWSTEVFTFGPPSLEDGSLPCAACPRKAACCPDAQNGRHITLPFDLLPFVDPNDPHLAKRFKVMLAKRTAIERSIKTLKCDLGTDQLTRRGNAAFQARLDKTLIAYHILLRS